MVPSHWSLSLGSLERATTPHQPLKFQDLSNLILEDVEFSFLPNEADGGDSFFSLPRIDFRLDSSQFPLKGGELTYYPKIPPPPCHFFSESYRSPPSPRIVLCMIPPLTSTLSYYNPGIFLAFSLPDEYPVEPLFWSNSS